MVRAASATVLALLSWLLLAQPTLAAVNGFNCCACTVGTVQNICALTPEGKPCDQSVTILNASFKKKTTCTVLADEKCKSKDTAPSAVCINEPAIAEKITTGSIPSLAAGGATGTTFVATVPEMGVSIPGVSFPSKLDVTDGKITNPYLAIYVVGIQKYLLGITLVVAAVMILWGGFRYLTSSIAGDLQKAKDVIQDSIIGLVIVLAAFVILSNINPQTTVFSPLRIDSVQKAGTPSDPNEALAMTKRAATNANQYSTVQGSGAALAAATTKAAGGPVKSPKGGYVAQTNCPPDMVAIKESPIYKYMGGKGPIIKISSFCIDRFEAPNQKGVKPFNGVQNIEADLYCDAIGKRLCNIQEWQRACSGPSGKNITGYAGDFVDGKLKLSWGGACVNGVAQGISVVQTNSPPAPCNYDSAADAESSNYLNAVHALDKFYPKFVVESIFAPNNPDLIDPDYKAAYDTTKNALAHLQASEPSGNRPKCVSEEGVIDMVGNVAEIVTNDAGFKMSTEQRQALGPSDLNRAAYSWASFYWSPLAHLACRSGSPMPQPSCFNQFGGEHALSWRGMENGFRCCMDLNENPDPSLGKEINITEED